MQISHIVGINNQLIIFNCVASIFIEEGLGIVVNTPCTNIWEGVDRGSNPLSSHAQDSLRWIIQLDFFIPSFARGWLQVKTPSNLNFYRLCPRGRKIKSWENIGAFRSSRMQSTVEIYFAHDHMGKFTMPQWHGYVSYHCHSFTYIYFTTCPLACVDKIKANDHFKLVLNH